MKTKILIVNNSYAGESRLTNVFVTSLDSEKYEVLVCYLKGKSETPDTIDKMGISRYLLSKRGKANIETVRKLGELLKEFRPDIVHCHRFDATLVGTLASVFYGIGRVVSHVHGLNRVRGIRRKIIANWMFKKINTVIAISNMVKDDVVKTTPYFPPHKVVTLYNAVEIDLIAFGSEARTLASESLKLDDKFINLVHVGRLVPTKGHKYLFNALKEVLKTRENVRLYLIGRGRLESDLKKLAVELGIEENVFFLGYREDVLELLSGFDLFVFPSVFEGLGLSLLEAMTAELPVVLSNSGGLPEVFGEGGFGKMVEREDSKKLASAIGEMISMPSGELVALGKKARERAIDGFSKDIFAVNINKIYESVMES